MTEQNTSFECKYQYKGPDLGCINAVTGKYCPSPTTLCGHPSMKIWQGEEINFAPLACKYQGKIEECAKLLVKSQLH
jgi:hypothetical protein